MPPKRKSPRRKSKSPCRKGRKTSQGGKMVCHRPGSKAFKASLKKSPKARSCSIPRGCRLSPRKSPRK